MSNYSDSEFSDGNSSWFKVLSMIPEGARVLDIGCSSGNFGKALADKKGCLVDGLELDPGDAKLAAKQLNKVWQLNVEYDDISDIPNDTYDIIYFGDVVEHLVQPIDTLARIRPLLSKTGAVLFSIPNMGHLGVRLDLLEGDFNYTETGLLDKTHLHFYNQREVVRVFEEAGYAIDQLEFVIKDYPKALLKKKLESLGLTPNETFYEKMQQTDASAFQFVGLAKPGKAKHHKLMQFGPLDLFESFHNDTVNVYESRAASLEQQLAEANEKLEIAQRELDFKKSHPYRSVAGHLKRKIK